VIPLSGWLSDKFGRRTVLMTVAAGVFRARAADFQHDAAGAFDADCYCAVWRFAVLVGFYMSPVAALFVEAFPTRVRLYRYVVGL